jgi:predicted amidohydrolase
MMVNSAHPFKTAIVQFNPKLNNRDDNIRALLEVVTAAAENGAKLIVTPEMATTGYYYQDRDAITPFVDTIPGVTTTQFEKIAKQYDAYIVIGMPEVDFESDLFYNSAALVGPEGYIGKYRKIHQWVTEGYWSCWGDTGLPVFETKIGNIAMMICQDAVYFESARLAAVNEADILVFPTNSSGQSISLLQAWAEINGLYVISANRTNTEKGYHMIGASAVWSPLGEKLIEAPYIENEADDVNEPTILYAPIDPTQYNNEAKQRLQERRPESYKDLMLFLGPWDYSKNTISYDITAATLQYEPIFGDKDANIQKIKKLTNLAVKKAENEKTRLKLVALPELAATGPVKGMNQNMISDFAETVEGPTMKEMQKLACEHELYLIYGFVEKEADLLYNSSIILTPEGKILGKYRKIHLNESDKTWATPGTKLSVFPTEDIGRIGLMIGYDAAFPETAGVMAVKRADIIIIPSNWQGEFGNEIAINKDVFKNKYPAGSMTTWDVIAKGAQAYTIISNFTSADKVYKGRSSLYTLDPYYGLDQPMVASEDKEEALIVNFSTLQTEWWLNQEKLILTRRTSYYKPIVTRKKWLPNIENHGNLEAL